VVHTLQEIARAEGQGSQGQKPDLLTDVTYLPSRNIVPQSAEQSANLMHQF
jgi:hypothetical protein